MSAAETSTRLPDPYHGVALDEVRSFLAATAADPHHAAADPPTLTHDGEAVGYGALDFDATVITAEVLAEAGRYDRAVIADAVARARSELEATATRSSSGCCSRSCASATSGPLFTSGFETTSN